MNAASSVDPLLSWCISQTPSFWVRDRREGPGTCNTSLERQTWDTACKGCIWAFENICCWSQLMWTTNFDARNAQEMLRSATWTCISSSTCSDHLDLCLHACHGPFSLELGNTLKKTSLDYGNEDGTDTLFIVLFPKGVVISALPKISEWVVALKLKRLPSILKSVILAQHYQNPLWVFALWPCLRIQWHRADRTVCCTHSKICLLWCDHIVGSFCVLFSTVPLAHCVDGSICGTLILCNNEERLCNMPWDHRG